MPHLSLYWKRTIVLLLTVLLAACASDQARKEGMALIDQGRYEEGLARLELAAKESPDDLSFQTAIKNNREMIVDKLVASGDAAVTAGQVDAARAAYDRALRLAPGNEAALNGLKAAERKRQHMAQLADARTLVKKNDIQGAKDIVRRVLMEDVNDADAEDLLRQIRERETKAMLAEPALTSKFKKPVNLQFRDANLKMVFEALARTSGINILLDKDVRGDLKTSIFVKGVSVEDTIDLILMQNQLAKKVLSDNTVFVYPDTAAKQKDYQDLMIRSFHLVNADAKQMQTMLKTILKTKDIYVHEKTNSIVIRDTPDAVRLAEKMIADQDSSDPEVMLEVEVLEVTRSALTNIGITWPDQLTLTASKPGSTSTTTTTASTAAALTLDDLHHLNATNILVSPALAMGFNLHSDHSDVNVLAAPRIRAKSKEKAKILIGDRVPVITNAVTPVSTGTPVVTGSVQYLDVGIKLDVEPIVQPNRDVTIKLGLEVSSITKEVPNTISGTLAYQIGTRNASTVLELKDGETQVLAGLINDTDTHTVNEVPVLGQIPILGRLFSSHKNDGSKSEIVLSITPHIVRPAKLPEASEVEYWSGTEANVRAVPVTLRQSGDISLSGGSAIAPRALPAPATPVAPAAAPSASGPAPFGLSWSGPTQARVGDKISVTLDAAGSAGLKSLGFQVNYDPAVLKAVDATEGNLFRQSDPAATFSKDIQQDTGQVTVDMAGTAPGGAKGGGSAATIVFEVLAASPQTQVTVSRIEPAKADGEAPSATAPPPRALTLVE